MNLLALRTGRQNEPDETHGVEPLEHREMALRLEELERENRRLHGLISAGPAGLAFLTGPEHRWTYINEAYVRLLGRNSTADFLDKTIRETLPELEAQGFHKLLDEVYRIGEPHFGREVKARVNRTASGQPEEGYFDFLYQPVRDSSGRVEGVYVYAAEVTDKVKARMAAEEYADRLRLAQTAAQIGNWEWDPIREVTVLSPELHRMFGTDAFDPEGAKNWMAHVHPADRPRVQLLMNEGHRLGAMEFEYRYLHPDLGERWFYCRGIRRAGETRMYGITQDVTLRKHAESDAQRLAAIIDSSDDAIVSKDLNGIINSWNPAAERIFGYKADEIVGQPILRLIPEELRAEEEMILSKVRAGERIEHFETTRLHKDGHRIGVSETISPVKDSSGRIVGASKVARDTSERRRRDELRFRLAAIVDSSDDAIVSKDLNGIVTSWNAGAERMFGFTAEEMIGKSITKIIPPELYEEETRILNTIARGQRIEHFETVRMKKNGELIEISLTISPVRDEEGRIIGAAKSARDITQQKLAERALRTSERLASVGRLAATVAHEINNPLEAVTNLIFLARSSSAHKAIDNYLAMAEEELERVSHLTKQTLGFYREAKGSTDIRVSAVVEPLLSVFAPRMRNKGIELCSDVDNAAEVHAVPSEIRQVVANLLSNAIDALDAGGQMRVRVAPATQWKGQRRRGVRLSIADTGSGIPAEIRAQLFEPFFTTKKNVGTGLGLWISKNIVENHHGVIQVRSSTKPGRSGTVFSVFLPASDHVAA